MTKKLTKSAKDEKIDGVCGGIAEHFGFDSTMVRLVWVLFTLAGGAGVLAYIIAMCVMPDAPEEEEVIDLRQQN